MRDILFGRWQIRAHEDRDVAALARHANNPNVSAHLTDHFPYPYTEAAARAFLADIRKQTPQPLAIAEVGGELVGGVGVRPLSDVRRIDAELGYWLGEDYWGQGIVTAAVSAITVWAFAELGELERIHAYVFSSNPASARVLEKAGYHLEGRLRRSVIKRGKIFDMDLYATLRGEVATGV